MHIRCVALIAIAIYPIGLIMVYSMLLFHVRHWIGDAHVTATATERAFWLQPLSFLYEEFVPSLYWWEIVEMLRRLVLVGFAVVIWPGSLTQLMIGATMAFMHLVVQLNLQPYRLLSDGYLAMGCSVSLVILLLTCIVLKLGVLTDLQAIKSVMSEELTTDFDLPTATLTSVLMACTLGVLAFGALLLPAQIAIEQKRQAKEVKLAMTRRLRYIGTGREVDVPSPGQKSNWSFHLFLSQ